MVTDVGCSHVLLIRDSVAVLCSLINSPRVGRSDHSAIWRCTCCFLSAFRMSPWMGLAVVIGTPSSFMVVDVVHTTKGSSFTRRSMPQSVDGSVHTPIYLASRSASELPIDAGSRRPVWDFMWFIVVILPSAARRSIILLMLLRYGLALIRV